MVSLEVVAILISGISISASLFYYANVLQNANTTRKTQLLQNMIDQMNDPIFWSNFGKLMWHYEWNDYNEFWEKFGPKNNPEGYGEISAVMAFESGGAGRT